MIVWAAIRILLLVILLVATLMATILSVNGLRRQGLQALTHFGRGVFPRPLFCYPLGPLFAALSRFLRLCGGLPHQAG